MSRRYKPKSDKCGYYTHGDCFARGINGICMALDDTDFGNRDCPFYKNRVEAQNERLAIAQGETGRKRTGA